ncbi:MAG: zinc-binding dehydrogenase [Devosia sp.]|nr:zinc-binding dehydrogenase [Devosia sp.]
MRAWVQSGFGGPEVRELKHLPEPLPAADEVIVEVIACALNRLDVLQRREALLATFQLPHIGGMDVVGTVTAAGSAIGEDLIGEIVVLDPVVSCETCDMCRANLPMYCRSLRTVGSTRHGGLAEYVAVPARNCIRVGAPKVTLEELAGVPVASVTAWHGLLGAGRIASNEVVVVPGAGSGLGVAGIQIAKQQGCKVITTVGSPAKVGPALAVGADFVIDRSAEDWVSEAREITEGAGVDFVWDHVGGPFLQQAIDACRIGGRIVMSGTTVATHSTIRNTSVFHWGKSLIGHGGYSREEMRDTVAAYSAGRLKLVVDSYWPFDELPQAEARLESGDFFGKVIVCMRNA